MVGRPSCLNLPLVLYYYQIQVQPLQQLQRTLHLLNHRNYHFETPQSLWYYNYKLAITKGRDWTVFCRVTQCNIMHTVYPANWMSFNHQIP